MKPSKDEKPEGEEERVQDEKMRELLENADLKKFDEKVEKSHKKKDALPPRSSDA